MILIVDRSKKAGESLAAAFRYMGIVAHCELPERASAEVSPLYRAILITDPENLPDEYEYIARIRSYIAEIPIIAITDKKEVLKSHYDFYVRRSATASQLYKLIFDVCKTLNKPVPGEYMLAGINASIDTSFVTYFSEPIPLTKTESLILRFLIRTYPYPSAPKLILKHTFLESKAPDISSIKTYICAINSKFKHNLDRNLIVFDDGGYVIMTPALAKAKEENFASATQ